MHIIKEANSAADWIANFGNQRNWSSFLVDDLPSSLKAPVSNDVNRVVVRPEVALVFHFYVLSIEKKILITTMLISVLIFHLYFLVFKSIIKNRVNKSKAVTNHLTF